MGKSAKTKIEKQTTSGGQSGSTGVDAATQAYIDSIRNAATNAAGQMPTSVSGAGDYYTSQMGYGNQGNAALNGDAAAAAKYMNPYQAQVIDQMNAQFGRQNQMTANQMNDAATKAGAFGGSRHGVATGVALAENAQNQAAQMAGLLSSGYTDAMGRAANAAGMGYNAAGANANLGLTAGNPDLWRMNVLKQGFNGLPYGQTYQNRNNQSTTGTGFESGLSFKVPGFGG